MKSMTGYGEASSEIQGTRVTVQVRSLNHRHLDLQLRAPREYLSFEEEIRKVIRQKISRGRLDVFINRSLIKGQGRRLELDEELLGQYLAAFGQAKRKYQLSGDFSVSLLSSIPDLFQVREVEVNAAAERQGVFKILDHALKRLERAREREGRQLKSDMRSQIRHLKRIAILLESRANEIGARLQKALVTPKDRNGSSRTDREASDTGNWILKGDINEEVVRLKSHVEALAHVIGEREPVGKKVDFMLQEVQRELNTISSKVPHLPVVQLVLEGKERVEKIREQTQNIE
ncbi:MAG TPA: YicC/YloC family endoribonuclease [Candidatus Binatia bacterium]|nr:YicC/YloC family endoribonuclease [Candidatus Binatia bacterium]